MDSNIDTKIINTRFFKIVFIIIIILVILLMFLSLFNIKKTKKIKHKEVILISDKKRIKRSLDSAGIIVYNPETFDNENIVFDSFEKINNNFETFLDYYIPLIETEVTNNIFKEFNIKTTIQNEINNNNLNLINIFSEPYGFITQALLLAYASKNRTNLILLGLCSVLLMKLKNNLIKNYKIVYFNDYNEETMDFIIYFIPLNNTDNIIKFKNDPTILDMNETTITGNEIFKLSLFNQLDKLLTVQINLYTRAQLPIETRFTATLPPLYEEDKIELINDLYKNRASILINIRLYLVSLFSYINNPLSLISISSDFTPIPTSLSTYIIDRMYNPEYYTSTYYNYLTININKDNLNNNQKLGLFIAKASLIASNVANIVVQTIPVTVTLPSFTTTNNTTSSTLIVNIPTTSLISPAETTQAITTQAETTQAETTQAETTQAETTQAETTQAITTQAETTQAETTQAETTQVETTQAETTSISQMTTSFSPALALSSSSLIIVPPTTIALAISSSSLPTSSS